MVSGGHGGPPPLLTAASTVFAALLTLAGCHQSSNRCPTTGSVDIACGTAGDPGRVTLRRLSRTEYNNTVHDLLGDTTQPANDFPEDDKADGFDNNGDLLTVSPLFMEKALGAAQKLVDDTWLHEASPLVVSTTDVYDLTSTSSTHSPTGGWTLSNGDQVETQLTLEQDGPLTLQAKLYVMGPTTGISAIFLVDGQQLQTVPVSATIEPNTPTSVQTGPLPAGKHDIVIRSQCSQDGQSLVVSAFAWGQQAAPVAFDQAYLRVCDPMSGRKCVSQIIERFGRRAWRRPLDETELKKLLALEAQSEKTNPSDSHDVQVTNGIRAALTAILASPKFLYRVELDDTPTSCAPHNVEDHELATRLAYTLWATTPDDHLLDVADQCQLHDPKVYSAELDRMLKAPQAIGFAHDFAGQWLKTQPLATIQPDPAVYPHWDEPLRQSMQQELDALFDDFLTENRPFNDILNADFSFVNDRLAQHYGLPAPNSESLVKVTLPTDMLGGLVTRGGILTATSHPDRTSPVRRGAWVLDALLCEPPPPPPAGVPPLPTQGENGGKTMKEILAAHRANPACASCHATIDPIGLGLENYDGIGQWRTTDQGETIDPSGTLSDGRSFQTPAELVALIKTDPKLNACVAHKLLAYSLGRSLTDQDQALLTNLTSAWGQDGNQLGALVRRVLSNPAFTMRRGGP